MSWHENFMGVLRDVIFADEKLKELMMIPEAERGNIVAFRDKYCVNETQSDTLIDGVPVRILYYEDMPVETDSINIMKSRIYFNIYVERKHTHDYGSNRLLHRGELIASRLNALMSGKKLHNMTFHCRGIYDLASKREGYDHKVAVFMYKRIFK